VKDFIFLIETLFDEILQEINNNNAKILLPSLKEYMENQRKIFQDR